MKKEYMSEKYDGIQARLIKGELFSRNGSVIKPPAWWLKTMPAKTLIGDLWLGYGTDSNDAQKLLGDNADHPLWSQALLMVFGGEPLTDEENERVTVYYHRIEQIAVTSQEQILRFYEKVTARGGEGVIIRGEDGGITKLKPYCDAEAEVIGYTLSTGGRSGIALPNQFEPGRGRPIASLIVRGLNGECRGAEFCIGSGISNKDRENPPQLGAIIKYRYQGVTKEKRPKGVAYRGKRDERTMLTEWELPARE